MSKLGRKDYWDSLYKLENSNYEQNNEDTGEVWFGQDSVEKMVDWVEEHIPKSAKIIDLGCGNGHLVLELAHLNYMQLTGVDYSLPSIELSKKICSAQSPNPINFFPLDITAQEQIETIKANYDVALDKGTFDAISLAQDQSNTTAADLYVNHVNEILKDNGTLLITSCNFTETELVSKFQSKFKYFDRIKYPTFTFGGVKGQTISTVAFKKSTAEE